MPKLYRRHGVFYMDFVHRGARRRRSLDTRDRELARKLFTHTLHEIEADRDPFRKADCRLADFLVQYEADVRARKSFATITAELLRVHAFFDPLTDRMMLSEVTRQDVERYAASRRAKVSVVTANNDLRVVRTALNWAVRRGLLDKSPFAGFQLFPQPRNQPRFLAAADVPRVLAAAQELGLLEFVALGLYAGLRKAEIAWLEWEDIDFQRGTLTVRNKEERYGPAARVKNHDARTIPLHSKLAEILAAVRRARGFVVHPEVPATPGKRYRYAPQTLWRKLVKRLGMKGMLTPHVLRHSFASHLVMAGCSVFKVSKWLGHRDVTTTMIYAHLAPQDRDIDRLAV